MSRLEEWKDIKGYEGLYSVSTKGIVFSHISNKNLKNVKHVRNYLGVNLYKNKKHKSRSIHRLVAEAFIPNPENKPEVNHIDGDPSNNNVENLEWVTPSENVIHSYRTGLAYGMCGENHGRAKLKLEDVEEIRSLKRNGYSIRKIMKMFNISKAHAENIVAYRVWKKGNWKPEKARQALKGESE
jgi:hypothetical protein